MLKANWIPRQARLKALANGYCFDCYFKKIDTSRSQRNCTRCLDKRARQQQALRDKK